MVWIPIKCQCSFLHTLRHFQICRWVKCRYIIKAILHLPATINFKIIFAGSDKKLKCCRSSWRANSNKLRLSEDCKKSTVCYLSPTANKLKGCCKFLWRMSSRKRFTRLTSTSRRMKINWRESNLNWRISKNSRGPKGILRRIVWGGYNQNQREIRRQRKLIIIV